MSWETDYFAEGERLRAEQLAAAEQRAKETGKELFDLARFEQLFNRGSQKVNEAQHRATYYLLYPELTTLADYAKKLLDAEPWNDAT